MTLIKTKLSLFLIAFVSGLFLLTACGPKTVEAIGADFTVTTTVCPSTESNLNFPEDTLNLPKTGVCLSGGGTRSMVCSVGQLKALLKMGLLEDVGYISCVSGGSWAAVPFTYYTKGAVNDEELLGTIVPPSELTINGMKSLSPGFLAGAANAPLLNTMLSNWNKWPKNDIWLNGVGVSYMEPYGIYDSESPKYFSYSDLTVAEICQRNPHLNTEDFIVVHNQAGDVKRPYLVVNSSINGAYNYAPYNEPEALAVFNYTPLGVGSAVPLIARYSSHHGNTIHNFSIGGGFIEPFAFGGLTPSIPMKNCATGEKSMCLTVQAPSTPFTMADASGTSSSAYSALLAEKEIGNLSLKGIDPREEYWHIPEPGKTTSGEEFIFGDGGNLENTGLLTLLQRGVNKVVVFVNSESALNEKYDTINSPVPTTKDISSQIINLFGFDITGTITNHNQVFAENQVNDLMLQMVRAKCQGRSIIAQTSLTTLENKWWGIKGGEIVDIVWVYNDKVADYINQLEPEIRDMINDLDGYPNFHSFPLYKTIDENLGKLVELTPDQINLLYQFSAWNVYSNPKVFQFLKPE